MNRTHKMSLYENALSELVDLDTDLNNAVKVWNWVRTEMDLDKFCRRVDYYNRENVLTKFVVMEYKSPVYADDSVTNYYIPGTFINTNCLDYDRVVKDYLYYKIANRDPNVEIYTRRKIVDGKEPHPFIRQLVVKFLPKVTPEPSVIPVQRTPQESLDDMYDKYYATPSMY